MFIPAIHVSACACGAPVSVVATEAATDESGVTRIYVHAACREHIFDGPIDSLYCGGNPVLTYV
jgi:hypothetical protein